MTGAQTSLLPPDATDERAEETDTAERCDDPTPRGVIRAALEAALPTLKRGRPRFIRAGTNDIPVRVLDVGAGYGAWSSELRRLAQAQGWPVHITGAEILEARRKHLEKWCDSTMLCDWKHLLAHYPGEGPWSKSRWDLAIGNPPFDELTGPKEAKRPPEECMPAVLLRHAPAVLLLHQTQSFQRSEAGRASWRHNPPAASWLVPGNVGFRGPGHGTDTRCYQFTLWLRDHTGPCSVYMLDDLPPSARSWTVPPGTEEPSKCQSCDGQPEAGPLPWDPACRTGGCPDCGGSGLDPNGDLPSSPGYSS